MHRGFVFSLSVLFSAGPAEAQHFDFTFAVEGGKVVTGAFDFSQPSDPIVPDLRLFARDLNTVAAVFTSADPGFTTATAAQLAPHGLERFPDGDLALRILGVETPAEPFGANLLYWDGLDADGDGTDSADVAFSAVPNGESLEIRQTGCFTCATITADGGPSDVLFQDGTASPFVVATQAPGGTIHKHLDFLLFGSGGRPTEGIYLLGLASDGSGASAAAPYYLLLHAADLVSPTFGAAAKSAAFAWVEQHLVGAGSVHDAAVVALKPPRRVVAGKPAKPLKLTLVNLGPEPLSITSQGELDALVDVEVVSLGESCAEHLPVWALRPPKRGFPVSWAPGRKLALSLDVAWACVNDAAASTKTEDHADFTFAVRVDLDALGLVDANPENDLCPRLPGPGDKGCGRRSDPFRIDLVGE
jgi:hypothetical protein